MKRERAILSVIVASLLLTTTFISLPFVVRAGLPLWPFGWVEPNSTTGVRAWDAVQNGDVAFYIQNRRDLGTSTDVITMNATGTTDYFYWNAGNDLNWDASNIGDPGVVIINRESGTGATRAGYVGYTTAPIPDDPPYLFPDCELQKIPTPTMVANGTDYINITWPALPDPLGLIAGYKIYRSTDNSTWTLVNGSTNAPLTNLYSMDKGLAQGIYYYSVKVCFIGYDNDNPVNVNNYQNAYYGEGSAPMATEMPPLTVNYIVLTDQFGTPLGHEILNIGGSITAYAAGYNSSTGLFVEFVEVEWSDNPIGLVSYSPGDATSKIFTAGMTPGEVDIVGENTSMIPIVSDNFTIEILSLNVDYIKLTYGPNGPELETVTLPIGGSVLAHASGYNTTAGDVYVGLVDLNNWWETAGLGSFDNLTGNSSTFTAGFVDGSTTIWGENLSMDPPVSDDFDVNILPPEPDYIVITDADGNALSTVDLPIGGSVTAYASGYNSTSMAFVRLVEVNWDALPPGLGAFDNLTGTSTTFTAGYAGGSTTITGQNSSLPSLSDDFQVNILPPTVDYIILTNLPDGDPLETVSIGTTGSVTVYASGYNNTGGTYVDLVEVTWSDNPIGLGIFSTVLDTSTTFTATGTPGTVDIVGENGSMTPPVYDNFTLVILSITPDYFNITAWPNGPELTTVDLPVDGSVKAFASAYNLSTGAYWGLINVTWSDFPSGLGSFDNLTGKSTIFTAGLVAGSTTITAENLSMTPTTRDFIVNILPPEVDFIQIRTEANNAGEIVQTGTYIAWQEDQFYAAGWNRTVGYLYDVVVVWQSTDPGVGAVDSPGTETNFTAQWVTVDSTCTVIATYGTISNQTGLLLVLAPTVDDIVIRDAPNNGGNVVQTGTYIVWEEDQFYAAGWNRTVGYLYDVVVVWQSTAPGVGTVDSPGTQTNFTAQEVATDSTCIVTATYGTISNQTGLLLVLAPRVDDIVIMDAPDNTGNPIWVNYPFMEFSYYSVGETDVLWAAGFNSTTGNYVEDIDVIWDTINVDTLQPDTSNGTVDPGPSKSTTFTANSTHGGALFVVAMNMTLTIGNITDMFIVIPPQVDEIKIMDAPDNTGNVVQDATYIVWQEDEFYAAGFNDTAGYIGDVEVVWQSTDPAVGTVDSPGIWTNFTAQWVTVDSTCTVTATYQGTISNQTGLLTVLAPKVDEIVIMDAADNMGSPVHYDYPAYPSFTFYNVGDTDEFWAAGFNFSVGYIGDVDVTWITLNMSFQPDTSNGTVEPGPSLSTNFTANSDHGGALWVRAVYTLDIWNLTNILLIMPPTPDEIEIRDAPDRGGNIVTTRDYDVGDSDMFYAAGINYTAGYIGDIDVEWTSDTPGVGTVVLGPSNSTTFDAVGLGTCTVTALNTTYDVSSLTGILTVTGVPPPTVDYIKIMDAPGGGGNEVDTRTYSVYDTDVFYAAAYNTTLDYLYDVVATWESDVTSVGQVDPSGHSTNFTAQWVTVDSTCTVKAIYQGLEDTTGLLTVLEPTVDYIQIRDSANGLGTIVTDRTYSVNQEDTFYAAACNGTVGYLYDVSVTWESDAEAVGEVTPTGASTTFTAQQVAVDSQCNVTATYGTITNMTGVLTVLYPRVDQIIIRDAPDDGGFTVFWEFIEVGNSSTYYAASYNYTVDYLGDLVDAEWVISDGVGTVTTPGASTTFNATTAGTGTLTVSYTYDSITITDSATMTVSEPYDAIPSRLDPPTVKSEGSDKIKIKWDPSDEPDIAGYRLIRSTDPNDADTWEYVTDDLITTTSYTDTGLDPDTVYYYSVIAVDNANQSSLPSDFAGIKTEPEGFPWILLLIFIIIAIVVILLILFLWRKKKKEEEALPPEVAPGVAPPEAAPLEEAPPEEAPPGVPEEEYAPTEEFEEYEEGAPTEEYEEYEEGVEEEPEEEYEEEEAPPTPPPPPPPP